MKIRLPICVSIFVFLAACNSGTNIKDNNIAAQPTDLLVVTPLLSCSVPSEATVSWNLGDISPSTKAVQVYVKDSSTDDEKLFSEGGRSGKTNTGKWVLSGKTSFILKDKLEGKIFSEVLAKGSKC